MTQIPDFVREVGDLAFHSSKYQFIVICLITGGTLTWQQQIHLKISDTCGNRVFLNHGGNMNAH